MKEEIKELMGNRLQEITACLKTGTMKHGCGWMKSVVVPSNSRCGIFFSDDNIEIEETIYLVAEEMIKREKDNPEKYKGLEGKILLLEEVEDSLGLPHTGIVVEGR